MNIPCDVQNFFEAFKTDLVDIKGDFLNPNSIIFLFWDAKFFDWVLISKVCGTSTWLYIICILFSEILFGILGKGFH